MIGLGQEDQIEEITLRPDMWWSDAIYHEADHCMKWPYSAKVFFSDIGCTMVLSFSERLVIGLGRTEPAWAVSKVILLFDACNT